MSSLDPFEFDAEKRLLLALLLSTAVLLLTPYLMQRFFPPPQPAVQERPADEVDVPVPPPQPAAEPEAEPAVPVGEPPVAMTRAEERSFEVFSEQLVLRFSTRGAVVESARLRSYFSEAAEPLELVPQGVPRDFPLPLSIRVGEPQIDEELAGAIFEADIPFGSPLQAPVELVMRYGSSRLSVVRYIEIPPSGYLFRVRTEVYSAGRRIPFRLVLGPGIGTMGHGSSSGFWTGSVGDFAFPRVVYHAAGAVERYAPEDVEEPITLETGARWVAFDSQYFSYLILEPEQIRSIRLQQHTWERLEAEEPVTVPLLEAQVGLAADAAVSVFMGPKDLDILGGVDPTLKQLVDYGWFGFLVRPLLFILKAIYGVIHNYGWAIIILTFLINLALLPVRYKQTVSMKKMSELQPQMKAIQNRYKKLRRDDPKRQEMNQEVMALYQKHGVNPLGGCLPLLVQMPFLFAFYRMLASSIELRGAPFIWWIKDLSKADPYYVTPIVMGLSMVAQQKMTPAVGDPAQRRMMMLMPVMFTFLFLSVSSGLAIYFLFSNLFGMLFQYGMQKMSSEPPPPPSKPKRKSRKPSRGK